ncbi:hypothetical protein ACM9HF_20750 [Colwellia sp. RE-S-Sl-9]
MKYSCGIIISLFFTLFLNVSFAKEANTVLTKEKIHVFSQKLNKINNENMQDFLAVLSKAFTLEFNVGSRVHGFILSFDNENLIYFLKKIANYPEDETEVKEIYDIKLTSPTEGEFKVILYSEKYRKKIWTHYFVRLENNEIKVIKILEKV